MLSAKESAAQWSNAPTSLHGAPCSQCRELCSTGYVPHFWRITKLILGNARDSPTEAMARSRERKNVVCVSSDKNQNPFTFCSGRFDPPAKKETNRLLYVH
ncbi:hypothetical protein KQX54_002916, partial [Cotesia glomerata]